MAEIIYLKEVDSTNRYCAENFTALPDGSLVAAETQSAGRGRRGRCWVSPPGENLYASFVIKKLTRPVYDYSKIAGLAVLDALRTAAPELKFWLKWPNDVYCRDRKICGILCEAVSSGGNRPGGAILGIGVNLNMPPEALEKIDQPATSIYAETGEKVIVKKFTEALASYLNGHYITSSISFDALFRRWKNENFLIGKEVKLLTDSNTTLSGKIVDIGSSGELIFDSGNGPERFFSGDVSIDKSSINFN